MWFKFYRVEGSSMDPILAGGDYVLASRLRQKYRPGDIVVVEHPRYHQIIKRVTKVLRQENALRLSGENDDSVSTEKLGPIPLDWVRGKVVLKIRAPQKAN